MATLVSPKLALARIGGPNDWRRQVSAPKAMVRGYFSIIAECNPNIVQVRGWRSIYRQLLRDVLTRWYGLPSTYAYFKLMREYQARLEARAKTNTSTRWPTEFDQGDLHVDD